VDNSYELCCLAHAGFYDSAMLAAVTDEPFAIAGGASDISRAGPGTSALRQPSSCCQNGERG
jgi:hypothetical protein